ncbi:hypothetical protein [Leptolyngbya iicbica]|uniref:Uncharacterized protein n=2 Tax=Cyanophyceae TaxID=3028117 RepID=A0A4V2E292_9CYAN|nr:hypothetical protein [Leptolyngbya sp. LK]RZM77442.1 hypothetical protein DYY88_15935 [Leptolyngbya sp. LK]
MSQNTAILYTLAVAGVIGFQICLMAGAPWGRLTQGGQHEGALPMSGRVAAGVSIVLLAFMGAGITSAAGLPPHWPEWTGWVALGIQALSTLLNWITLSAPERRLWAPITSIMLGLATYTVLIDA